MPYEYDPKILHMPENPTGPVAEVIKLLDYILKIEIDDERVYIGTFTAFDKFGNIVLTDVTEYFRDQERNMNMVIIPLGSVKSMASKPPEPAEAEETN